MIAVGITAVLAFMEVINDKIGSICHIVLNVMVAISLITSVLHMRRTVKATHFAFPKEKLVKIHSVNFVVWFLLYFGD